MKFIGGRSAARIGCTALLVLALTAIVDVAPPLPAAAMTDRLEKLRVVTLFALAGIPVKSYVISGASMLPTLAKGDEVLADLRDAGRQPQRGELIVYWFDPATPYAKRVIGLPGDRVALRSGHIILNGEEIAQQPDGTIEDDSTGPTEIRDLFIETPPGCRPYKIARTRDKDGFLEDIDETVVAPGFLYLLGDSRDNSVDSRFPEHGPVEIESVIGRIVYRLHPNSGWLAPRESVPDFPVD
jgi:signal peptidase I